MDVTDEEIVAIQKRFPDLYINTEKSKILGELSFSAYFDGEQLHLNPSRREGKVFRGCYEIEIRLNELNAYKLPKVFEIGGKILKYSQESYISPLDLHLNGDGSCCLSIFTPKESTNMTISTYVKEAVFPFFAWQAYSATYGRKAPWGEYSLDRGFNEKVDDILVQMKNAGRNDPCPCGSGLKYKQCCLDLLQRSKRSIQ